MKYLAFRIAQFLSRSTPRRVAYWIGETISWFHFRFSHESRCAVMSNLARIHSFSGHPLGERELRREAREVFRNFAKYLVDFFSLFHLSDEERSRLIDMGGLPKQFRECLQQGKGVIAVTAHIGNWELAGAAVCMSGFKVNAVVLVQADPKLNELFQSQRLARGMQVIPMGHAAKPCLKALRRNEIVAVLGDRDFTSARVTVDFFGKPARLPHGPAQLAIATGAALLPTVLVRKPDDTFQFIHSAPIIADGLTVEQVTARIAEALEKFISQYPTQWLLFYDFWDVERDLAISHAALAATQQPSHETHAVGRQQ